MSEKVTILHGGGGKAMEELIARVVSRFSLQKVGDGLGLPELDDAATIPFRGGKLAFTTDSYTVNPIFFPGGDIGKLAACGTVNDLACVAAKPIAMSLAFVIGEGMSFEELDRVAESIELISKEVGFAIVTGDTKVIDVKGLFVINTTGLGIVTRDVSDASVKPGDAVILTGTIGDHGITIMSKQRGIELEVEVESDCAPLWSLVEWVLGYEIHAIKDPTRGGLAACLCNLAERSKVCIEVEEERIPVREGVKMACELLGLDPLQLANEGKLVITVPEEDAEEVLKSIRKHDYGKDAEIIGRVVKEPKRRVILKTEVGGKRIVEKPLADPVPRVC